MNLFVTKRNGHKEPIDLDKIHRVLDWAAEGLDNVSVSQVELKSHIQFYDGIRTADIHETVIKAAADLISEQSPDYQYMAARLAIFHLRKKAYGQFEPPHLYQHVAKLVDMGKYDKHLLEDYSQAEFEELNQHLDHWRDMDFSYAAVKQLEGKYLVQNRVTGEIYESPQFLYILVAACLFSKYPKDTRLDYIKRFYDAVSTFKISLPTPIMSGVRTPTRQFSSCVLIECDDSLDSINATASAIVRYVSQRAGIGINAGRIRGLGSPIRGGEAFHTGCIPSTSTSRLREVLLPGRRARRCGHPVLPAVAHRSGKPAGTEEQPRCGREPGPSHGLRRADQQADVPALIKAATSPCSPRPMHLACTMPSSRIRTSLNALYVKYEKEDPSIRKKTLKAVDLFSLMMQERAGTGRIYIQNVDHCNTHSPFDPSVAPVRQSNLCLEIALPTKPLNNVDDEEGEIALCTLSAFNLGAIEKLEDLEEMADLAVRALDAPARLSGLPAQGRDEGQHEPPYPRDRRHQLRLLPGEERCPLLRRFRSGADPPHLRGDPVLPVESLRAAGPRVRPLPGLQRDHLCPGDPAHRYL